MTDKELIRRALLGSREAQKHGVGAITHCMMR